MRQPERFGSFAVERFVGWLLRHRLWVVLITGFLGLLAVPRTVFTYAALRSDLEQLLPEHAPSVVAWDELRRRLPGARFLGVVIDTGKPENVEAAVRFIDDLAARVKTYPDELADDVRTGVQDEREFAETYALQLMDVEDVRELRKSIERRRDWEVTHALDINLLDEEEDPAPEIPINRLREKYEARYGAAQFPNDRFVDEQGRTAVLLIHSSSTSTGSDPDQALIARVKKDIEELGFPDAYAPGMELGLAGDVAARVEEMDGLRADLFASAAIVVVLIGALLVWYYGSLWSLPLIGIPLFLGASYSFGLVALPPISIRYLNSNTAFLGSIVLGNGINTGILLSARIQEERQAGESLESAIVKGVSATWRPTLASDLSSAVAYGSLIFTDFRGFNQFGWIGFFGLMLCWVTTMTLSPVLLSYWGGHLPVIPRGEGRGTSRKILDHFIKRPWLTLAVTVVVSVVAVFGIQERSGTWMEYDFSKLRRRDSWVSGERYWGPRMNETLGRYLTPTVVLADDAKTAELIKERVEKLADEGAAGGLIGSVQTLSDVLRPDRFESTREVAKISELLTPRMLGELSPEDRRLVERAVSDAAQQPLTAEDIPDALVAGFREHDGRLDRNVLIFPKLDAGTWQSKPMLEFTQDLRRAAFVDGQQYPVAGSLLLSSDITEAMRRDGPRATLLAIAGVLGVCLFAFRGRDPGGPGEAMPSPQPAPRSALERRIARLRHPMWLSAGSMASIFLGVLLMMGIMAWSGERLNFTNFVAIPITFGIGADYSINMLRRWQSAGSQELSAALASTGGAITMCSLTTIIGFGSLLASQNRMLFSFGVLAVAGEIACLVTALVVLPVVLGLLLRTKESPGEQRA